MCRAGVWVMSLDVLHLVLEQRLVRLVGLGHAALEFLGEFVPLRLDLLGLLPGSVELLQFEIQIRVRVH